MNYLLLTRSADGTYTISDHNSEKLFVVATILLQKTIRSQLRNKILDFPEFALGEVDTFNFLPDYNITVKRDNQKQLIISLLKKHESLHQADNPLVIDVYIDVLGDLIEDFEDLVEDEDAPTIYLTLVGDLIKAQATLPQ
jgi:hypothetical protein